MLHIELNSQEAGILHRILSAYLGELNSEIASTEIEEFGEVLKQEQEFVIRLLRQAESLGLPEICAGEYDG